MPRLSRGGRISAPGSGLGAVSVDGAVVHPSGSDANWLTETQVAFQGCGEGGCQILVYDTDTGQLGTLDGQGANWLRAKDGGWAAWLNGTIRTSAGWQQAGGYIADVALGRVLIADSSLRRLTAYSLAGETLGPALLTGALGNDATAGLNVRYRDGLLLYQDTFGWHLLLLTAGGLETLGIAPRTEAINAAVPVLIDSRPWLLERSERLTLRPYDSTLGYEVTTELCYGPDVVRLGAGVRAVWSLTAGEAPGDIHTRDLTFETPPIDLNVVVHADLPQHTDVPQHVDLPHTDHADAPHTDAPHHTDLPHTDTPGEPDMKHAIIAYDDDDIFDIEVVEQPHQDGAPNVALQSPHTKQWLAVEDSELLPLSWREESTRPGAWERFIPVPGGYVAKRTHGNRVVFKAGPWEE